MKKIILSLALMLVYLMPANAVERTIGLTLSGATIDSAVKDDVDNNGTIDTTKSLSNDVAYGSIFFEITNGPVTFGIDVIPMEAEFEARSQAQTSTKAKADGAAPQTSGNNSGSVDVSNHITVYVQPGFTTSNGVTVFGTLGYVSADVDADVKSISSTNKTVDLSLDGVKMGIGVKKDFGNSGVVKLEYAETDYDDISVITSNDTKITADMDNTALSLSIGKKF